MQPPEIVLDIGVNYYELAIHLKISPLEAAEGMIRVIANTAKNRPRAVVKFQWYKTDRLVTDAAMPYWDTGQEKAATQKDLFSQYDKFDLPQYTKLKEVCDACGLEFMATAFDSQSLEHLNPLVKRHKIASGDITNYELLSQAASYGKPVILSTGAATICEIYAALEMLRGVPVTVLHCIVKYPQKPEESHLWKIRHLKKICPECRIGYSDHSQKESQLIVTAWLLGAEVIEKHFTCRPAQYGNDHYHAIDKIGLKNLYESIEKCSASIGDSCEGFNTTLDEQMLARWQARRGVYLKCSVNQGQRMMIEDVDFLRPQLDGITPIEFARKVDLQGFYPKAMQAGEQIHG